MANHEKAFRNPVEDEVKAIYHPHHEKGNKLQHYCQSVMHTPRAEATTSTSTTTKSRKGPSKVELLTSVQSFGLQDVVSFVKDL